MNKTIVIDITGIAKGDPQKISANLKKFNKAEAMTELSVKALATYETIETVEQMNGAMETMKEAAAVSKAIETRRVQLVKPFNESVSQINGFAKGLTIRIDNKIALVKSTVLAFKKAEEERQLQLRTEARIKQIESLGFEKFSEATYKYEDLSVFTFQLKSLDDTAFVMLYNGLVDSLQQLKQKETEVTQEASELDAVFGGNESLEELKPTRIEPMMPAPSYNGTSYAAPIVKGATKRWTYEVTDISQVPREYLVIDSAAVRKAIADGTRTIAGLRIFQDESITLR